MAESEVKKEISNEDDEYNKDIFLFELEESLQEMNEMRKRNVTKAIFLWKFV